MTKPLSSSVIPSPTPSDLNEATRLISATADLAPSHRVVNVGVERGSTVLFERAEDLYGDRVKPSYGTDGLGTHEELKRLLAGLEGASDVFLVPSGLAALTVPIFASLKAGDEVLLVDACYGPTRRFLTTQLARFDVVITYYPAHLSADEVMALASEKTRLIILESPGSMTFDIQDIPGIAKAARARGILTLCDNTYGAGVLFKPLAHGVDISMQALAKYVGGHADVLIGSIAVNDKALASHIYETIRAFGHFASADEAYLATRGLRTLHLRLKQSGDTGLALAQWLEGHDLVEKVLHPGLESHPGHAIFKRDFTGVNGLFSVILKGGDEKASQVFLNALKLFGLGFSWGGHASLAVNYEIQLRARPGYKVPPGSHIRLYVGLEAFEDLKADLSQALEVYRKAVA
jgi:cysteine-S-conjugate beta-lyase